MINFFYLIFFNIYNFSDKEKRGVYDRLGEEGLRRGGGGGGGGGTSHTPTYTRHFSFHPRDPFDLFKTFFGGHDPFLDPFGGDPFHTRFHQQVEQSF